MNELDKIGTVRNVMGVDGCFLWNTSSINGVLFELYGMPHKTKGGIVRIKDIDCDELVGIKKFPLWADACDYFDKCLTDARE